MIKHFYTDELLEWLGFEDYDIFKTKVKDVEDRIKYFHIDNEFWRDNIYICKIIEDAAV